MSIHKYNNISRCLKDMMHRLGAIINEINEDPESESFISVTLNERDLVATARVNDRDNTYPLFLIGLTDDEYESIFEEYEENEVADERKIEESCICILRKLYCAFKELSRAANELKYKSPVSLSASRQQSAWSNAAKCEVIVISKDHPNIPSSITQSYYEKYGNNLNVKDSFWIPSILKKMRISQDAISKVYDIEKIENDKKDILDKLNESIDKNVDSMLDSIEPTYKATVKGYQAEDRQYVVSEAKYFGELIKDAPTFKKKKIVLDSKKDFTVRDVMKALAKFDPDSLCVITCYAHAIGDYNLHIHSVNETTEVDFDTDKVVAISADDKY